MNDKKKGIYNKDSYKKVTDEWFNYLKNQGVKPFEEEKRASWNREDEAREWEE